MSVKSKSKSTFDYTNIHPQYKFSDDSLAFTSNSFPVRPLRGSNRLDGAWIVAYKEDARRHFEAIVSTQKLNEVEINQYNREVPKRFILRSKSDNELDRTIDGQQLDGFYLMNHCCVEDPSDVATINITGKNLHHVKEDDMTLFDNVTEIIANENNLTFEAFKTFPNLKHLSLACNNLRTLHLKQSDFTLLESLDLSYNNLNPNDIVHLGILQNLKCLKLSGNNLSFLPDTFSKPYVMTNDKSQKMVYEKFPNLEDLYLDHNRLTEESSFDVLSILRKLKKLYLNDNNIASIPYLKIFGKNHVIQEFSKSYYNRKNEQAKRINEKNEEKRLKETVNAAQAESKGHLPINATASAKSVNESLDLHKSNLLRNSFILEEDEEEEESLKDVSGSLKTQEKKLQSATDHSDKTMTLPFAELLFIDLSNNKFTEEDDLIAVVSWPMLNEILLFGNPIITRQVGCPPLLKKFLVDRLGIKIERLKPLKPLKVPVSVNVQMKESRKVSTYVPKVPKVPVDMKMLAYYSPRNDYKEQTQSNEYTETVQTSNESPNKESRETENLSDKPKQDSNKDYNSFFMTQADHEETEEYEEKQEKKESETPKKTMESERKSSNKTKKTYEGYELLLNIENEESIKIPRDVNGCVRALRNILDHPLVYRDDEKELDKPQNPYSPIKKKKEIANKNTKIKPRVEEINNVLDELKERKHVEETNLRSALNSQSKKEHDFAKKLLNEVQQKYNTVRFESLRHTKPPQSTITEAMKYLEKIEK